jgi:hypothetical protein
VLILYYVFTWLVGYSLVHAYLWNLAFLVFALVIDEYMLKMFQSKKLVMQLKKEKNAEKNFRFIQWMIDSFVSFKTILYVFYAFVLIVSQIIEFSSASVVITGDLENFILMTKYNILLLIAFDMIIGHFSKDKERTKNISAKLKKNMVDNQD